MSKAKEPVPLVEIKVQPNPLLDLIEKELRPFNRGQYFETVRVFAPWDNVDVSAKLAERAAATTAFKEKTQAEIFALQAQAASPEAGINATLHLICGAHRHASWCLGLIARLDRAFKELDPEAQALSAPLVSLAMTLGEHMKLQSVLESKIVPMAAAFKKRDDAARAGHDISQSEIELWSERWRKFEASDQRRDHNGNPKTRGRLNAFYEEYADVSDENGRPYSPEKIRLRLERASHVPARKPYGKKLTTASRFVSPLSEAHWELPARIAAIRPAAIQSGQSRTMLRCGNHSPISAQAVMAQLKPSLHGFPPHLKAWRGANGFKRDVFGHPEPPRVVPWIRAPRESRARYSPGLHHLPPKHLITPALDFSALDFSCAVWSRWVV